ncbi:MAG: flagellar M-ring protein FliF, partial [Loktanella sp.]|nr:flagellar M-ring protein FliF [Loktanella sp.]
ATLRDTLRMSLAGEGLPANGSQGYELLDQLSGFSTTSQMFDAAYWRAKEGELARTILANPNIRAARVHISTPSNRPFDRDQRATAAVTVTTGGGSLSAPHIRALQFLVGAAVPGLTPENVAVIDDNGGLLSENDGQINAPGGEDRATALRQRAERLLAARVGSGNAVVEVAIDTVMETETISERLVDPESRIAISTDVTESSGTSNDSRNGGVTVASNLPDGDATANGASSNETAESRVLTNYEISETQRQLLRQPGAVRRLTVAVLINEPSTSTADGSQTSAPRSVEELLSLQELVASAVGLDPSRGDVITLKSMPFDPIVPLGTEANADMAGLPLDLMQLIQIAVLAAVALILGLFVVRPILAPQRQLPNLDPPALLDAPTGPEPVMAINELGMADFMTGDFASQDSMADDPVTRMRRLIAERKPETVRILQNWIEDKTPAGQS